MVLKASIADFITFDSTQRKELQNRARQISERQTELKVVKKQLSLLKVEIRDINVALKHFVAKKNELNDRRNEVISQLRQYTYTRQNKRVLKSRQYTEQVNALDTLNNEINEQLRSVDYAYRRSITAKSTFIEKHNQLSKQLYELNRS